MGNNLTEQQSAKRKMQHSFNYESEQLSTKMDGEVRSKPLATSTGSHYSRRWSSRVEEPTEELRQAEVSGMHHLAKASYCRFFVVVTNSIL